MHSDDAAVWGYIFDEDLGKYVALPDDGANPPPFHLHLLGNPGPTFVLPTELEDVALIHARMSYAEYFALLATCVRPLCRRISALASSNCPD